MHRSSQGSIKSLTARSSHKSFQSKMDKMSEHLYDIVKSGSMVKRAQNKKRFTPVNYKQRWFELSKRTLSYFDAENVEVSLKISKNVKIFLTPLKLCHDYNYMQM